MDHHFDSKIVLSEESQYKSLYKWFLREVGDNASKYQRDQIPWSWTQYFQLIDAKLITAFELSDRYGTDRAEFPAVAEKEHIHAKLFSGFFGDERLKRNTSYSMFGTSRTLDDISLVIYPISESENEKCVAWGCVSYTTEFDFRDETTPDTLCFHLHLKAERFAQVAKKISDRAFTGGTLRVGGVDGFYTYWSPEISTSNIKVLTSHKEHDVEIPEGCSIVPPRLGKVAEMELRLLGEKAFAQPVNVDANEDLSSSESEETSNPVTQSLVLASSSFDAKIVPLLKSVRAAAWIIALVLVLMLFKHV